MFFQIKMDTSNFWTVNWYYLVALSATFVSITIAYKNYKKKPQEKKDDGNFSNNSFNNSSTFSNKTNVPVNITNIINNNEKQHNGSLNSNNSDENMKATTKILFIDDNHTEYKIVSILKKAGWIFTKSVKDINNLDVAIVRESDIIFVDINGVGLELFEDQGLGLASALKKKYPKKKIVIYSAETTGDRFHQALREVDHCLPKNADAYQFINLIENLMKV
ncbi:hypothetical protein VB776_00050 [Arcicella sp. DC2W]|uniref:Response regulator n=1 Tax=Arcicella gelida TaxID=2984195 RepID=A0ABU5RYI8_9BACT|nr:hypothetical protein [Arcicella sp. DC2W]MEA5401281.1 hypothetical protein [Arcicella sp. DC2W]